MNNFKDLIKNYIVPFGILISFAWVISSFILAHGLDLLIRASFEVK